MVERKAVQDENADLSLAMFDSSYQTLCYPNGLRDLRLLRVETTKFADALPYGLPIAELFTFAVVYRATIIRSSDSTLSPGTA